MQCYFLNRFATVEIAHIKTKNLKEHTLKADIIFTAVGKSEFLDSTYFREDAIVIDIAITKMLMEDLLEI